MTTLAAANLDPALKRTWTRLLIAFSLSVALHLALLMGVPVNPTGGIRFVTSVISARLEPAASETPSETATEPQPPDAVSDARTGKSTVTDPLADPVQGKTAPKPEPTPAAATPPASPSSGIELPLARDPTYYTAKQLDVYPQPLAAIQLHYPETAVADRLDGRLLILLLIDEFGVVTDFSVVEAEPAGYFEEAARSVFRASRFAPGMRQGRAVKSRVLIQVRYTYGDSAGSIR